MEKVSKIKYNISLKVIYKMRKVELRMNEKKYEVIKELVDHNGNKTELLKNSVYQDDKLTI